MVAKAKSEKHTISKQYFYETRNIIENSGLGLS
jgi:hypothetical protein